MAAIRPLYRWPLLPLQEATRYKVPVDGPTLGGMCEAVNTLVLARLAEAHLSVTWDASSTDILENDPTGLSVTHRITWESHPRSQYLWVAFHYQADPDVSGSGPYVDFDLNVQGGANVDRPAAGQAMRFDENTGLETQHVARDWLYGTIPYEWPLLRAATPWTIIDSPASYPSDPRLMNIGSDAGSTLELLITAQDVRIHTVDIVEAFQATDTQ